LNNCLGPLQAARQLEGDDTVRGGGAYQVLVHVHKPGGAADKEKRQGQQHLVMGARINPVKGSKAYISESQIYGPLQVRPEIYKYNVVLPYQLCQFLSSVFQSIWQR
jgi:hypothetical protein